MHGTPGNRGGAAEHFHNLQTLTDELLEHVLSRCSVMDICRVSKVSRRLRDVTWRSEVIWAEQWSRTYPGLSPPPEDQEVARTDDEHATEMRISSSYMLRAFREQWTRRSRDAAVVRRARRAARASKVQVLEQGVHRLQRAVQAERALLASLHEQLHGLSTSRSMQRSSHQAGVLWHPHAVQQGLQRVTEQVPLRAEEVEASLQQRLRESRLELSKLSNQLGAETRRLRAAHAKLAQLLP
ncbi:hypothetical protein ACKKBG_A09980 [Auxenochlorella protothecoides x Auxenochlorella symbiontica]